MTFTMSTGGTDWLMNQLWPDGPTPPNGRAVWAILDGARDQRVYDLVRYSRMDRACLFAGQHPEELLRAAPHLIRLSMNTAIARDIVSAAWGNSWGVFLTTSLPLDKLRFHLRGFLRVRDQQGRRLMFRYYDPRVLREYLPTCTAGELETVFGPIDSFIAESRDPSSMLRFTRAKQQLAMETLRYQAPPSIPRPASTMRINEKGPA